MANQAEFKLKYTIEADNSKAKKDLQEVDGLVNKLFGKKASASGLQSSFKEVASEISNITSALTGDRLSGAASQVTSLADAFGAIPGPAGLAVGAIAGIGVAAVGAGTALFELTKQASEYGSVIHDASDKTGLHARTLSAMDVAAKQSGTSLDQVVGSVQKFAQTVGQAAEGSDKAVKSITALGLDPKKAAEDLDGALAQVFKRIVEAKTPVEQNTLAFQAFGKQGKELLPFIKQFDGDLPGLIKKMDELGVTISDKDAVAADEFGDQLVMLEEQIGKVATKIGIALMPTLNRLDVQLSQFLAHHQDAIASGIDKFAFFVQAEVEGWSAIISKVIEYGSWLKYVSPLTYAVSKGAEFFDSQYQKFKSDQNSHGVEGTGFGGGVPGGELPDVYGKNARTKPPKTTDDQFRKFFTDQGFEVSRTFGEAVNKGSLHPSGKAIDIKIGGKTEDEIAKLIANAIEKGYRFVDERVKQPGIISHGQHLHFEQNLGEKGSIFGPADLYGSVPLDLLKQIDQSRLGKGAAGSKAISTFTKKQLDDDAKTFETYWSRKLEIEQAGNNNLLALRETELDAVKQGGADYVTANEKASAVEAIKLQQYQEEIDYLGQLEDYYRAKAALTKDTALQTELLNKADETHQKIDVKTIEMQTAKIKLDKEEKDTVKDLTDKYYDFGKTLDSVTKAINDQQDAMLKLKNDQMTSGKGTGAGVQIDRNFDAFGELRKQISDANNGLGGTAMLAGIDAATQAFQGLGDAVGSAVEAFVLYGSAGQSVQQVTAQILGAIAKQAAVQAVYELAQGFAMLALSFFGFTAPAAAPSAAYHFASAAIFAGIAGVSAGVGRGVAGNSFNKSKGGSPSSTGAGGQNSINQNPAPYSRSSPNAFVSGRDHDARFVADAIDRLNHTINTRLDNTRPGDVLTTAIRERRGLVTQTVISEISSNAGHGTKLARVMGGR